MKAIVLSKLGGPEQLQLIEVPTPEPGPGQVRVRLRASALNRRDVWITLNQYPKIRLPAIMGSDGAGVIDKLGADAPSGLLGQEVMIYPAYDWGTDTRFPLSLIHIWHPRFQRSGLGDQRHVVGFLHRGRHQHAKAGRAHRHHVCLLYTSRCV